MNYWLHSDVLVRFKLLFVFLDDESHMVNFSMISVCQVDPDYRMIVFKTVSDGTDILFGKLTEREIDVNQAFVNFKRSPPLPSSLRALKADSFFLRKGLQFHLPYFCQKFLVFPTVY